jgi:hypothetical protein
MTAFCISVKEKERLSLIGDVLHDQPFRARDVRFDAAGGEVTIPFMYRDVDAAGPARRPWWRSLWRSEIDIPLKAGIVRLRHVTDMAVDDRARIDSCEFNTLTYNRAGSSVVIDATPDLSIALRVTDLEVSVQVEDGTIGTQRVRTYLGFIECTGSRSIVERRGG